MEDWDMKYMNTRKTTKRSRQPADRSRQLRHEIKQQKLMKLMGSKLMGSATINTLCITKLKMVADPINFMHNKIENGG